MPKLTRRRWLLLTLLAVHGLGAVAYWLQHDSDRIGPRCFRQLHVGMTRAEVDAILGEAPPIDWQVEGGDAIAFVQVETLGPEPPPAATRNIIDAIWSGTTYQVWINFDAAGRLQRAELKRRHELPFWQRIRCWAEATTGLRL